MNKREPLSLNNKRKIGFIYYLYTYNHQKIKGASKLLNISASEVLRLLIEEKLDLLVKERGDV